MAIARRVAVVLTAAAGAVVVTVAPVHAAAAFTLSGTRVDHAPPYPEQLLPALFANDTVTRIDYPAATLGMDASIAVATAGVVNAIQGAVGPVVAAGFSQGAVAIAHVKQVLMALAPDQRPAPANLRFVTVGDPAGPAGILRVLPFRVPFLGLTPITPPDTPYDTVIVNGEYDGWADLPDRPWNLISLANALLGIAYVHGRYEIVPGGLDLSTVPAANITTTTNSLGGRTTQYLIPTANLPLLQPLRDIGIPESVVRALEQPLRAIVDAGYIRHDAAPVGVSAAAPVAEPALPAPEALTPDVPAPTVSAIEAPAATVPRGRTRGPVRTPVVVAPAAATDPQPGEVPVAPPRVGAKVRSGQDHSARSTGQSARRSVA